MSDCRWTSSDQPRALVGRHVDDCDDEHCRGCVPCPWDHCRECGVAHVDGTQACPVCVGAARGNLRDLARMCRALPEEVAHRGVEGEAMVLLGPVADPEAWGNHAASALAGRIVPVGCDARDVDELRAWLDKADGDRHPLWFAGSWRMVWEDALGHESDEQVTVDNALGYLDRHLSEMAGYEDVPWEDFARDLRQCVAHVESVLHDGEQVDRGVPCLSCKADLQRTWGKDADHDGWRCPRCKRESTEAQYRVAVRADYLDKAEWLTDTDMTLRTGVTAGTVRSWSRDKPERAAEVRKRQHEGRVVYCVADVEAARERRAEAA